MLHFWLFRATIRPLSSKALPLRSQASCPLSPVLQVSCLGFCYVANTKLENVGLLKKWYVLLHVFFQYVSNQICSLGSSLKETTKLAALKLSQLCIAFHTPCLCGGVLLPLSLALLRFPFIYFFKHGDVLTGFLHHVFPEHERTSTLHCWRGLGSKCCFGGLVHSYVMGGDGKPLVVTIQSYLEEVCKRSTLPGSCTMQSKRQRRIR
jgi:hypothetical protein